MTLRTNEQFFNPSELIAHNFQLLSSFTDKFWDMWMVNLGSVSWLNEQWENMFQTYLTQRKSTRQEFTTVVEQLVNQLRKNTNQVEEMLKEAWKASAENVSPLAVPGFVSYLDLVKQVDELSKKVDAQRTEDK